MEWTYVMPGKKLRSFLAQHAKVIDDQQQQFDIEKPITASELKSLLANLLSCDEIIEAVKPVRLQLGLKTADANLLTEKN